jgi:signal transduction histidine kinase
VDETSVREPRVDAAKELAALAYLPNAALAIDELGIVRLANRAAEQLLKRPAERLVGFAIDDILLVSRVALLEACIALPSFRPPNGTLPAPSEPFGAPRYPGTEELTAGSGQFANGELTHIVTVGKTSERTLSYAVAHAPSQRGWLMITLRDVTEWAKLRREHDRLLRLAAAGEVLPSVLHELKNPLAAVTAAVEVLVEEVAEGHVREQLHAVLSEVRRMKLAFEGVGSVGRDLRGRRPAPIDQACREVFRILAPRAESAGAIARCDVPDMPPVLLDPAVVRAILFNLFVNAIHASATGTTIVIHARLSSSGVFELTVADTGTGMTAEVYRRCTELFFTTKRSGSGVGLALCRKTTEEAGGTLEIQSVPGVGTTIVMRVPSVLQDTPRTPEKDMSCRR